MPTPQMIHFVLNTETNEVQMFATRVLPVTNNTGCRLKWWRINVSLEQIGTATTRQWSYIADSQRDELQHHLGPGFKVLQQFEALKAIENGLPKEQKPVFYIIYEKQGFKIVKTGNVWNSEMQAAVMPSNVNFVNTSHPACQAILKSINAANGTNY